MKDIVLDAIPKGNTRSYKLTLARNGLPVDITGWSIFFTMKVAYDDGDDKAIVKKKVTVHSDPTNGISILTLIPTDTETAAIRKYYYDFKALTNNNEEFTLQKGTINVDYSVTRRDT